MTLRLTESQVNCVLNNLSRQQFIDFLARDIEQSVHWICDFIFNYVDSKTLQDQILKSIPPIQMELFND
jgi:hypothetical protein